jgi:capsular polysaccharide transport system permease protein
MQKVLILLQDLIHHHMSELLIPTVENHLSIDADSCGSRAREISLMVLPLRHTAHLENFADNFGEGWVDPDKKLLRLQFQWVVLFDNAKVDEFWLSVPGSDNKIALSPSCIDSAGMAQKHPQLAWSGQSRFVLNEEIALPNWAISATQFELFAGVSGRQEKIGVIQVGGSKRIDAPSAYLKTWSPTVIDTSAVTRISASEKYKQIPLLTRRYLNRLKNLNRLFLITVVLPTCISIVYFGLIASDSYTSESRFVVRSPEHQANSGLGSLLQGTGFSRSQDDTYTVHDFIFSRDALRMLDDQLAVGKAYANNSVDMFSRFAGLGWDKSFEALHRYYLKHVTIDTDSLSSISTLTVSAFTASDAYHFNEKLLEFSESLVNQLNERGRQDMIRFAAAEVVTAQEKAKDAALAVSKYRNLKGVFDPEKQSSLQLQQVSKMQDELIATKIQLAQIRSLTRDNPQIPALQMQIETLQREINSETAKVAGGDRSLADKSTQYEGLILERGFAEKQLAAALTWLEQARNDAQRKQLYLERIVQPSKPDFAMEPRRIRNVLATFVLGLIAWGILTMLLAGVREHQN